MQVKSIIVVCPSCEGIVVLKPDEVEFETYDGTPYITCECTECGAFLEREPVEAD